MQEFIEQQETTLNELAFANAKDVVAAAEAIGNSVEKSLEQIDADFADIVENIDSIPGSEQERTDSETITMKLGGYGDSATTFWYR